MERRKPSPEEMKENFVSWRKKRDETPVEKIEADTEHRMLETLDLTIDDFRGKRILDLGSGPSALERTLRNHGIDSVVSLERHPEAISRLPEVKGKVAGKSQEIPLRDDSIDLAISFGSAPTGQKKESEALKTFNEMNRILAPGGEARIFPPRLRFISDNNKRLMEIYSMKKEDITQQILEERYNLEREVEQESLAYAKERGYNIELIEKIVDDHERSRGRRFASYWILKKSLLESIPQQ